MGALEIEPKIAAALRQSFPSADDGAILRWATAIYDAWVPAAAIDALQRGDKPSGHDIQALAKAARQLRGAAKELNKLGGYGGTEVCDEARRWARSHNESVFGVWPEDAGGTIADHINGIATALEDAAGRIPKDAPTVNSFFGEGPGFERHTGRPRNAAARAVALDCARAYEHFSGRQPKVSTNPMDNSAYGPFLDLIDGVFSSLGIDASAETWARYATRQGENHPE